MNTQKLIIVTALAALLALSVWPGDAAAQSLSGVIVDYDTGEPIAGARVHLSHYKGVEVMYGVRADDKGHFDAANAIQDGEFEVGERVILTISARGYKMYEEHIRLPKDTKDDEYRLRSLSGEGSETVAPRQVWIEVLLIEASGSERGSPPRYPKEIEPVVENLSPLFKFSDYKIVGRTDAMGMEGSTLIFSSNLNDEDDSSFEVFAKIGFGNGFIKLPEFVVHVQGPQQKHISTALNLPQGEMVILGASRGEAHKRSLITVVSAKFLKSSGYSDDWTR
jgi:hypothetical protein